jgi:TonB family protein
MTGECEYKNAQVFVEFGLAKDGRVQYVDVLRSSGFQIYDDYAVNAVKLSSRLPEVPDSVSRTGFPVRVRFTYSVHTSILSTIR